VGRNGKVAASYVSNVEPDNSNLVATLEKALAAK
jgi:hypothetical protein